MRVNKIEEKTILSEAGYGECFLILQNKHGNAPTCGTPYIRGTKGVLLNLETGDVYDFATNTEAEVKILADAFITYTERGDE